MIWIDAHGDLHTPYTTPSGNYHGMPVANMLGLTNRANGVRELNQEVHDNWKTMQHLGLSQLCPKLSPENIFFIDIRDLEKEEWDLIEEYKIAYLTPNERKKTGIEGVVQNTLDFAQKFDALYISFDVDSLDGDLVPGTGTPVSDGLSWSEAEQLLKALWTLPQATALEVTEINPLKDYHNQIASHMNQVLQNVLSGQD